MRFLTSHPVLAFVSASLIAFGAFSYFWMYSGYCWKEHRFLSLEEKIRITLPQAIPRTLRRYGGADQFLKENPDCCYIVNRENRFGREGYPKPDDFDDGPPYDPGLLSLYLHGLSGMMAFEFPIIRAEKPRVEPPYIVHRTHWVKACGGVYRD